MKNKQAYFQNKYLLSDKLRVLRPMECPLLKFLKALIEVKQNPFSIRVKLVIYLKFL